MEGFVQFKAFLKDPSLLHKREAEEFCNDVLTNLKDFLLSKRSEYDPVVHECITGRLPLIQAAFQQKALEKKEVTVVPHLKKILMDRDLFHQREAEEFFKDTLVDLKNFLLSKRSEDDPLVIENIVEHIPSMQDVKKIESTPEQPLQKENEEVKQSEEEVLLERIAKLEGQVKFYKWKSSGKGRHHMRSRGQPVLPRRHGQKKRKLFFQHKEVHQKSMVEPMTCSQQDFKFTIPGGIQSMTSAHRLANSFLSTQQQQDGEDASSVPLGPPPKRQKTTTTWEAVMDTPLRLSTPNGFQTNI
jgi:hypothetical protein